MTFRCCCLTEEETMEEESQAGFIDTCLGSSVH